MSLKLAEIFFSLQGEGPLVGMPSLFFRLYGCNLSCLWCDTPYAREPYPYFEMEVEELISLWRRNYPRIPYLVITGGEPLLQKEVIRLLEEVINLGAHALLETNGSLSITEVPKKVTIVMDLKPPSSGMSPYNCYENLNLLKKDDAVKFVVQNKNDFNWALRLILANDLLERTQVFFSPAYPSLSPQELVQYILAERLPLRLQVQLHKIINLK